MAEVLARHMVEGGMQRVVVVERVGAREHFAGAEDEVKEEHWVERAGAREHFAGAEWQREDEMEEEQKMKRQQEPLLFAKM